MPYADAAKHRENAKEWRDNNRDRVKANVARWRLDNKEKQAAGQRKRAFKRRYGITVEQYDAMVVSQKGECLICSASPKVLHVDHNHETKQVRGLLCLACNTGIGLFKDNIAVLMAAIGYIRNNT